MIRALYFLLAVGAAYVTFHETVSTWLPDEQSMQKRVFSFEVGGVTKKYLTQLKVARAAWPDDKIRANGAIVPVPHVFRGVVERVSNGHVVEDVIVLLPDGAFRRAIVVLDEAGEPERVVVEMKGHFEVETGLLVLRADEHTRRREAMRPVSRVSVHRDGDVFTFGWAEGVSVDYKGFEGNGASGDVGQK